MRLPETGLTGLAEVQELFHVTIAVQGLINRIEVILQEAAPIEEAPLVALAAEAPIEATHPGGLHIPQVLEAQVPEALDTEVLAEAVHQEALGTEVRVAEAPEVQVAIEARAEVPEVLAFEVQEAVPDLPVEEVEAEVGEEDHKIIQSIF